MATWKKVIVSGSSAELAALQVDNLTSGSVVIGGGATGDLTTTPINGTGNIVATTGANGVVMTGSFTGSFSGQFTGTTDLPDLTQGVGIVPFLYDGGATATVAVSGAAQLSADAITKWDATDGKFVNSSLTDNGTVISGISSLQLTGANSSLSGSFSGSFFGDGNGLVNLVTTLSITSSYDGTSGSVDLKNQGLTIAGTANEVSVNVSNQTVTIGLPDDVVISDELVVQGNLTVFGTASFQATTNLEVADRFVLFASGSNVAGDGGIVVQQGTQNVGELFAFDSGTTRWAFTSSFNAAGSSFTPDAFVAAAVVGVGTDPTVVDARYQAAGNIFIGTDENIWIYS